MYRVSLGKFSDDTDLSKFLVFWIVFWVEATGCYTYFFRIRILCIKFFEDASNLIHF